jgi:flavin-dependent dehydrogenase
MTPDRFNAEARRDTSATMASVIDAIDPDVWRAVSKGTTAGPIRGWPGVRAQFRKPYGPGWALVGDAGYFKDPFAAHGISDAFRDAELLTEAVIDGDYARYERQRDQLSMPMFVVLDQIASFQWDLDTLPDLHLQLSQAMRDEETAVTALRDALTAA